MIPHPHGCVFGARRSTIGPNCWIGAGVVMSPNRSIDPEDNARERGLRIGGAVTIGSGAILVGSLDIGDYAVIGAGAVVLQDVPSGYTAVGNPARLIPPKTDPLATRVPPASQG
ncbi:MAG: hypothetical protein V2J02_11740 [Pseudomonadales bacterium]|nr:hypothetical protein [Pseudomonadales bacterium]